MSYARRQRNPTKHLVSISLVIVLHVLVIWALANGLARKAVPVLHAPVETKIIEEVKPPSPPSMRIELAPPPKFTPPPAAFVAPPEVRVQAPPPPQTTITVTPTAPAAEPPGPAAPRVQAPPTPAPLATPAPPNPMTASVICPGYMTVLSEAGFPREAARAGVDRGSVTLKLTIAGDGSIARVDVVSSTSRTFNRGATQAARRITCQGQGREVEVLLPIEYRMQ